MNPGKMSMSLLLNNTNEINFLQKLLFRNSIADPCHIKGVVYLRGLEKSFFFFLHILNVDVIRNTPYEGFFEIRFLT